MNTGFGHRMAKLPSSVITRQDRETERAHRSLTVLAEVKAEREVLRAHQTRGISHRGVIFTPFSFIFSMNLLHSCTTFIVCNEKLLFICLCLNKLHVFIKNMLYTQPYQSSIFDIDLCHTFNVVLFRVCTVVINI